MKKTSYIYIALSLWSLTGCIESGEDFCDTRVQLSLSVTSGQGQSGTRLADDVTLTDGTSVRTVQNFWLIPYSVTATDQGGGVMVPRKITASDTPLSNPIQEVTYVTDKDRQRYYYGKPGATLFGTASFLCYAQANPLYGGDEKQNGSITTNLSTASIATSDIYFAPTPIYNNDNTPHATATAIANYLTTIATAGNWYNSTVANWQQLFEEFTNEGNIMAGSSASVQALVQELKNVVYTRMTGGPKEAILAAIGDDIATSVGSDFPASIGLPDGAAVLQWNTTTNRFEPQTQTTTLAQVVSQNRFAYPAEMYFYANSQIHTSTASEVPSTDYADKTWDQVLAMYPNKYATIDNSTLGAAIVDPLHYGVGSLKATVVAESATLADADEQAVTLSENSFPLTGLLISGQYKQGFDFTPKSGETLSEYVIYDSQFSNIYLRNTTSSDFSTLAFQSKDGESVRLALEFENQSGQTFRGVNGLIYPGTKFYLVAELSITSPATYDYEKRVFTQDYVTSATLSVKSLKNAYNVVPDLLSARLEVGVAVQTEWIETNSTTILK